MNIETGLVVVDYLHEGIDAICCADAAKCAYDVSAHPWGHISPIQNLNQLLSSGDGDELLAFFGNPHLDTDVLAEAFAREGKYADLPDERWMAMVIAALRNPQLQEERWFRVSFDGYDMYQHLMTYWAEVMQDDVYTGPRRRAAWLRSPDQWTA